MARIRCEECRIWVVDLKKERFATRAGERQLRPPGAVTPCRHCPKQNPDHAKTLRMSPADWKTLDIYLESRATCGATLTDGMTADMLLRRRLAVIDGVFRSFERQQAAESLAFQLVKLRMK